MRHNLRRRTWKLMRFKRPFFISSHAVRRFRERVARLPTRTIRTIIQAALQDNYQQVMVQAWNKRPRPVYRAQYMDKEYWIPVIQQDRTEKSAGELWPVVPTILLPGMEANIYKERNGWHWN